MTRRCHWCGRFYDSRTQSSIWCEANPKRGRGEKRWRDAHPARIIRIGVLKLKHNPWSQAQGN